MDKPDPRNLPKQPSQPLAYETPDEMRPASASPTEQQLESEAPTIPALDANPPHDPYAALRLSAYRQYAGSYVLAVIGGGVQSTALQWEIYQRTGSALSLGWIGGIQVIPLILL